MLRVRVQTVRFPAVLRESTRNPLAPVAGPAANSRCEPLGQTLLSRCPSLPAAEQWHPCRPRFPPVALRASRLGFGQLSRRRSAPLASRSSLGRPLEGTTEPEEHLNPSALQCTLQYKKDYSTTLPGK